MKHVGFDAPAFLEGVIGLNAEQRGFYITLIALLYARAPRGDVTDQLVVKAMACRPQVWRRVKAQLMACGKVRDIGGKLTANRVETTLQTAMKLMANHPCIDGVLGGQRKENQQVSEFHTEVFRPTKVKLNKPSLTSSSFPAAARESEKRKKKAKSRPARSLASAPNGGALTREPDTSASPSLAEIIQAKGWAKS